MSNKSRKWIAIVIVLLFLNPYTLYIRDWSKKSHIDKYAIESLIRAINSYDSIPDICNKLRENGDLFGIGDSFATDDHAEILNYFLDFAIYDREKNVQRNTEYGYVKYATESLKIITESDIDVWLDVKVGRFRPIFNLMCKKYTFDGGSCWLSPNMLSKNEYGFADNRDEIVLVLFCEKYTVVFTQEGWGGDKAFEQFLYKFYYLISDED